MSDRDDLTATRVLAQRRAELQAELEASAQRALEAHQALIELIAKDDALRQAIAVIAGEPIEPETHFVHRLTRVRGRLESLTDDLKTVMRLAGRRPHRSTDPKQQAAGSFLSESAGFAPAGVSRRAALPSGSVERVAVELARRRRGVIRIRDLAEHINERYPGRFASPRSAYASISAQLERSAHFVKGDRGEFLLISERPPRESPTPPDTEEGGSAE